jgi:hypothetical protein
MFISAKKRHQVVRVSAVVDVVAIKLKDMPPNSGNSNKSACLGKSILLAALAIPGIQSARADTAPERAALSYKYLDYQDSQPGWDRIGVRAHAMSLLIPIAGEWSVEGSLTSDTVSGASPSFRSERLIAGEMKEKRTGRDIKVSRYFSHGSLAIGGADSHESDYSSHAFSVSGSISTESKNATFNFGIGRANDRINAPHVGVNNDHKKIADYMVGVTQILTPYDIAQLNLTYSSGHGYFSDPYKFQDNRPRSKTASIVQTRWNHHFASSGGTGRFGYRYYADSFGIRAHTLTAEYVQQLAHGWTVTPMLRLHTQSAASFYLDSDNPDFPNFAPPNQIQSQDQRLSAFGGRSLGIKIGNQLTPDLLLDLKYEYYEQRPQWRLFGSGSPDIEPFMANILQFGVTYFF